MHDRTERAIRGTAMGAVALVAAASSHALAGGEVPGWLGIAVGFAFASVVGTVLVARRPSLPRTALIVGASQAAFHYLFVGLGGPGVSVAAHVHAAAAGVPTGTHADHAAHLFSTSMLVAHALAAAVTVLVLRRAETAVWRMLRRLARAVRHALGRVVVAHHRIPALRTPAVPADPHPLVTRLLAAAPRRGPPVLSA